MSDRDEQRASVTCDAIMNDAPAQPLTAAQRQRAYRLRRKQAAASVTGHEESASRVNLVATLNGCLAALDDCTTSPTMISAHRNAARRILQEFVTRYAITL